jgi:hypothetical protein
VSGLDGVFSLLRLLGVLIANARALIQKLDKAI